MRFVVSSSDLLGRLQVAGRAIASKSPVPILDNFLFSITGKTLSITGSDSEVIVVTTMEVNESDKDGKVAIPGGKLVEYLKKLPEQPVTFNINDETFAIEIATVSGKNNQVGLNANDYPQLQSLGGESQSFSLSSDVLLAGISHTLFATGNDELRPIMNGVFFDIEPDGITFVATDSHILARYTRTDVKCGFKSSFVLGKKPAALLKNIMSAGVDVKVTYDSKSAIFEADKFKMTCRLTDGNYPQYRSVIPTNNPFRVMVNRQDLSNAISRSALFSDGTELIRLELSSNSVNVMAQDLDFSCSANEVVACQYEGEQMVIGIKSSYFSNIMSNMNSSDIEMQLSDASRAVIVLPVDKKENEDELMLIMPMKV
ncbi:MAG: DNA polymerase III subunit beta [Bacteroidales bacterium]|nr:DNA polymerase III subunit beta [Bacteroidales bacterium]